MERIITLNNQIGSTIRSIRVMNNNSVFSLKINKEWLFKWARRIATIAIMMSYITITMISYSISPVYFWTLVKAGTILSLLLIIALSKN